MSDGIVNVKIIEDDAETPLSDEAFQRQRRNLVVTSVIMIIISSGAVGVGSINLGIFKVSILNNTYLLGGLFVSLIYFLYRYVSVISSKKILLNSEFKTEFRKYILLSLYDQFQNILSTEKEKELSLAKIEDSMKQGYFFKYKFSEINNEGILRSYQTNRVYALINFIFLFIWHTMSFRYSEVLYPFIFTGLAMYTLASNGANIQANNKEIISTHNEIVTRCEDQNLTKGSLDYKICIKDLEEKIR